MWRRKGLASTVLLPLAWVAGRVVESRKRRARAHPPQPSALPTVVVGNLVVGGTGKTPVVIAIAKALQARGWTPGIVSRGYGVRLGAEPRTGQGVLDAAEFGDEPALIARATGAPIAVHPRRSLARLALARHFPAVDVVISDDGLQHLSMSRDVEIIVQDARGIGNGRLLPAGPLREPAAKLAEVDFIVDNGGPFHDGPSAPAASLQGASGQYAAAGSPREADNGRAAAGVPQGRPERISMRLQPAGVEHLSSGTRLAWSEWAARHRDRLLAAVAAIGQPERFFDTLREAGLQLGRAVALPDHDAYASSPFPSLREETIAITAKDAVKCGRHADPRVWVVHVEACFSDPSWLDRLDRILRRMERP